MDKKTLENLYQKVIKLAKIKDFYYNFRQKTGKFFWKIAYWGGVATVGLLISVVILQSAGMPVVSAAYAGNWVVYIIGNLIYYYIVGPIGALTVLIAYILQAIINYPYGALWTVTGVGGGFVNVSAVVTGWQLVRDVCNIFFSVLLVLIALATVLGIEAYHWKKLLPNFILMAILINFSKSICGIFTDLATVLMATFGGSFVDSFATGLLGAFGLPGVTDVTSSASEDVAESSAISVLMSYIAAAVMVLVMFVVTLVFTIVLIFRIVMLWFLIVLSPLAYVTRILPQTKSKSSEWWKKFGQYCAVGPLVTFFLWLSLTMAFSTDVGETMTSEAASGAASNSQAPPDGYGASTSPNVLANFLIAIMMLMASLQFIQEMAGEIGKYTGMVQEKAFSAGKSLMTVLPRGIMSFTSGRGAPPPKTGPDNRTWGQRAWHAAGNLASTGYILSQPLNMLKIAAEGVSSFTEGKEKRAMQQARGRFDEMRKTDIVAGEGRFGKIGQIANTLGRALSFGMAMLGGAATDPEAVQKDWLSTEGIMRIVLSVRTRGNEKKAADIDAEVEALQTGAGVEVEFQVPVMEADGKTQKKNADGTPMTELVIRRVSLADAEAEEKRVQGAMTEAEFADTERQLEQARVTQQTLSDQEDGIETIRDGAVGSTDAIDISVIAPVVQIAIDGALQDLQASLTEAQADGDRDRITSIRSAISDLENAKATGGDMEAGDLMALCRADGVQEDDRLKNSREQKMRGRLAEAHGAVTEQNEGTIQGLVKKLVAAGAKKDDDGKLVLDADGKIQLDSSASFKQGDDSQSRNLANAQLEAIRKEIAKKQAEAAMLRRDRMSTAPLDSYSERTERQKIVGEKMDQIKHVKNSEEVRAHLARAIQDNDQFMAEACLRHITSLGDLNEVVQQDMSDDPDARSDAEGLEHYRQKILVGQLGMTQDQAFSLANDLTYDAEDRGYLSFARAYRRGKNGWEFVRDDYEDDSMNRSANVAGETIKSDPTRWTKFHRLAYGYEDHNRQYHLSSIGLRLLVQGGETLAQPYNWNRMNDNAKLRLSTREIIQQLKDAGVHQSFIRQLEDYRAQHHTDTAQERLQASLRAYHQREAAQRAAA